MKARIGIGLLVLALAAPAQAEDAWAVWRDTSVIEIRTSDADGTARDTHVWVVVVGDAAYVRTNDSKWLANIRRGSEVSLRAGETELAVRASEVREESVAAAVEAAFKAKYGLMQKLMSALRVREPTVVRLDPK